MRIFLDKKGICGTVFPMRAGCAKQRFNLPWPNISCQYSYKDNESVPCYIAHYHLGETMVSVSSDKNLQLRHSNTSNIASV